MKNNKLKNFFVVFLPLSLVLTLSAISFGDFASQHPRRAKDAARAQNQQRRIANGLNNGTMSAGQAAHVERQEASINRQKRQDVRANGGHLTAPEQQQITKEQNGVSQEIHNDKHP